MLINPSRKELVWLGTLQETKPLLAVAWAIFRCLVDLPCTLFAHVVLLVPFVLWGAVKNIWEWGKSLFLELAHYWFVARNCIRLIRGREGKERPRMKYLSIAVLLAATSLICGCDEFRETKIVIYQDCDPEKRLELPNTLILDTVDFDLTPTGGVVRIHYTPRPPKKGE